MKRNVVKNTRTGKDEVERGGRIWKCGVVKNTKTEVERRG